jgi:hypothetical protein
VTLTIAAADPVPASGLYQMRMRNDSDAGSWLVEDVISHISGCGVSPQRAELLADNGHHALQLRSVESLSGCEDTVAVRLLEIHGTNIELNIPLAPDTTISFHEVGELIDPQMYNPGEDSLARPDFDNISLFLKDNNGNYLLYVLAPPGAVASVPNRKWPNIANLPRSGAGSYRITSPTSDHSGFYPPK